MIGRGGRLEISQLDQLRSGKLKFPSSLYSRLSSRIISLTVRRPSNVNKRHVLALCRDPPMITGSPALCKVERASLSDLSVKPEPMRTRAYRSPLHAMAAVWRPAARLTSEALKRCSASVVCWCHRTATRVVSFAAVSR